MERIQQKLRDTAEDAANEKLAEALSESQTMLVSMLSGTRTLSDISEQIKRNRAALKA
jgi:hypothetical protein